MPKQFKAHRVTWQPQCVYPRSAGKRNGQEWIRTTEGKSQQIYSLQIKRVKLTFTAN